MSQTTHNTGRTFKFRAWGAKNPIVTNEEEMIYDIELGTAFEDLNDFLEGRALTFMQWTGLKDKNGVLIYESDILKAHGIVAWNDVEHKWSAIDINWNNQREWHCIDYLICPFEVIGNIYQNPELLT